MDIPDRNIKVDELPNVNGNGGKTRESSPEIQLQDIELKQLDNKKNLSQENNQFHYIESEENGNNRENNDEDNLINIIQNLGDCTDLNSIISMINRLMAKKSKKKLDKDNLSISLSVEDLDKFDEAKKMMKDFNVKINFSLNDK
jgi:hypothetical protein